ncbi:MAG: AraC family transcriptional regulator [Bacillota bacterium]|nr:MAG: AraC family transcriptional regulator [Bacillota bacterium]
MEKKYYRHRIENLLNVQKIVTVHYFEFGKSFVSAGETHDFWEMVYADKGEILCTAGEEKIALKQGEALFHKPNEFHALAANGLTAPNVFIVSFECKSEAMRFFENRRVVLDKSLVKYVYALVEESKNTFFIPYADPDAKKLPLAEKPALGGLQIIRGYLEMLLIYIMRAETEKKNAVEVFLPKEELDCRLADMTAAYLTEHVCGKITAEDVCRALNYNRAYVFRQFKKATGETVMRYYTRLKIEKAKQLLREGQTVTQTANALCFDTPNYFSKTFKKYAACTPVQYKKMHFR